MNREKNALQFIEHLQNTNPQSIPQLSNILKDFVEGKSNENDVIRVLKDSIRKDSELLNKLNDCLDQPKKITYITKEEKKLLFDYIIQQLYIQCPQEMENFAIASIQSGIQRLDHLIYFSIEDLIEEYFNFMSSSENATIISKGMIQLLREVLDDFKYKFKNKELLKSFYNNGSQQLSNNQNTAQEDSKKIQIKKETQIFEVLEDILNQNDYQTFLKLFFLYHKNIISYMEFIKLVEHILVKLDKNICLILKSAIESREQSRQQHNPFNQKLMKKITLNQSYNPSYKQLEPIGLQYTVDKNALVNKSYYPQPINQDRIPYEESNNKNHIKNQSEEEILKIEDEMHEFDLIIQQFRIMKRFLKIIQKPSTSPQLRDKLLVKIHNMDILNYLYSKKTTYILEIIKNNPEEILPILFQRIDEKLELVERVKKDFSQNVWRKGQDSNYFKSLDTKSNFIKIIERKRLINKNLIKELKRQSLLNKKNINKINFVNTINDNSDNQQELIYLKNNLKLQNPIIAFKIEDTEVIKDVIYILQLYIQFTKQSSPQELSFYQEIIQKLLINFFNINQDSFNNNADLLSLEQYSKFFEEAQNIEKSLQQKKHFSFLYGDKLFIKIQENKFQEMMGCINKQKQFIYTENPFKEQTHEYPPLQPKSSNQKQKLFFAYYQIYIFYRYFIFIYERFQYAKNFSFQYFQNLSVYNFFKKALIYHNFGLLDQVNLEDIFRIVFGQHCGIFLNFERIFINLFKIYKTNKFCDFVLNFNSHVFTTNHPPQYPQEEILFTQTAYFLNQILKESQTKFNKNSPINTFHQNYNVDNKELLKFEYLEKDKAFVVHKIKSPFNEDEKKIPDNISTFINRFDQCFTETVLVKQNINKYYCSNNIGFKIYDEHKQFFIQANNESVYFSLENQNTINDKKEEKKQKLIEMQKSFLEE